MTYDPVEHLKEVLDADDVTDFWGFKPLDVVEETQERASDADGSGMHPSLGDGPGDRAGVSSLPSSTAIVEGGKGSRPVKEPTGSGAAPERFHPPSREGRSIEQPPSAPVEEVVPPTAQEPPSPKPDTGLQVQRLIRALEGESASDGLEPIDFSDLLSPDRPRPTPLITYQNFTNEYIFAFPGEIIRVAGDPGVGKSFFLLELTLAMRTGAPIAGMSVRPSRVMWIDEEGAANMLRNRLVLLQATLDDLNSESFRYYLNTGVQLDVAASRERLFRAVADFAPEVIVIDSVVRIASTDENSAQEQAGLYNRGFKPLSRTFGATVFLIDHTNKTGTGDKSVRGSGEKSAQIDRNWLLVKRDKDSFDLAPGKVRDGETPPRMTIRRSVKDGTLKHLLDRVEA